MMPYLGLSQPDLTDKSEQNITKQIKTIIITNNSSLSPESWQLRLKYFSGNTGRLSSVSWGYWPVWASLHWSRLYIVKQSTSVRREVQLIPVFVILLSIFALTPALIREHSRVYPRSLPRLSALTPASIREHSRSLMHKYLRENDKSLDPFVHPVFQPTDLQRRCFRRSMFWSGACKFTTGWTHPPCHWPENEQGLFLRETQISSTVLPQV